MPEAMTTALSIMLAILVLLIASHLQAAGHRKLPVLMYHKVRPGPPDALTVPLEVFTAQLDALRARGYESISFAELLATEPLPPKPVLLTFDDAYADFEPFALESMRERGFKATVFLPVGHVGGENVWDGGGEPLMDWDDLRRLGGSDVEWGLHSWNHDNYRELDVDAIRRDLQRCRTKLREESITFADVLAYPYGGFPRTEPARSDMKTMFRAEGLRLALRIGSRVERTTPKDPYEMRRVPMEGNDLGLRLWAKLRFGRTRL
jgi:peptidoglycan/xylan/chitin deacetylase (PgdA/CDA1 family)